MDKDCTLFMDEVNWTDVDPDKLLQVFNLATLGELNLKGVINLTNANLDIINAITEAIGDYVFEEGGDLRINAPTSIFLSGPEVVQEGQVVKYSGIVFSDYEGISSYSIIGSRVGTTINSETGVLTTIENEVADSTIVVRFSFLSTEGEAVAVESTVTIKKRIYPTIADIVILGPDKIESAYVNYSWESSRNITGDISTEWLFTGPAVDNNYLTLFSSDFDSCVISKLKSIADNTSATISMKVTKVLDGSTLFTKTKEIFLINENIAVSQVPTLK